MEELGLELGLEGCLCLSNTPTAFSVPFILLNAGDIMLLGYVPLFFHKVHTLLLY